MANPRVLFVVFDGVQPLDIVGPHEVFGAANQVLRAAASSGPTYDLAVAATKPGQVTSENGLLLYAATALPRSGTIDTLIVPGGNGVIAARGDTALVTWVRRAAQRSRRVASVCSGAFVLAHAGLLDNRRVTTHWRRGKQLARDYPKLIVDTDPIYIRDGNIWTSAGVTAGIDLALAMVEEDHGCEMAQTIARNLVMFLRRPGGQSQFACDSVVPGGAARIDTRRARSHPRFPRRRSLCRGTCRRRASQPSALRPPLRSRGRRDTRPICRARPR